MVNTLPYLNFIQPHLLIAGAIILFFLSKVVPALQKTPFDIIFIFILATCFGLEFLSFGSHSIFFGMLIVDPFSRLYNQIFFIVIAAVIFMIHNNEELDRENILEIYGLLATICLGMMLMASAANLLMAVVAIELVSLPSYILVSMNRQNQASKEASLKYLLFGSFATGIMIYGMSLLFGLTGELRFAEIWSALVSYSHGEVPAVYYLAVIMTLSGMIFKIAAVPFHFWCPDAYQAAPTPITAFLSTAPKVAGFAILARFLSFHLPVQEPALIVIITIISIATMTLGNLAALRQKDIKRLLAYSSISHAGFLLMGIAVMNEAGRQVVFFYILIYILMNLGAFMAVMHLSRDGDFQIQSFKGLLRQKPLIVIGFAVCLFSLAGLPPFGGFIGKFYLFKVVIEKQLYLLAVAAAVNSVISLYYYVNVIKVMIIESADKPVKPFISSQEIAFFVGVCAISLIVFGLYWAPLLRWSEKMSF